MSALVHFADSPRTSFEVERCPNAVVHQIHFGAGQKLFDNPSIRTDEPVDRMPKLAWKPCPVVERQRPSTQARITRDRIVLVEAAQDRIFHLAVSELLRDADEFLDARALAQGVAAYTRVQVPLRP
jgi:hypothetical protein